MCHNYIKILVGSLFLGCYFIISSAEAKWGPFLSLSIEERYDSNIFLDPEDFHRSGNSKSDFITEISPSIGLSYETQRQTTTLKYSLNYSHFVNNSDQSYTGHNLNADHQWQISKYLMWYLHENLNVSEEPQTSDSNYDYISVNYGRRRNLNNSAETGIEYFWGKQNKLKLYYSDNRLIYLNEDKKIDKGKYSTNDSVTYGPGIEIEHWFNIRNGLSLLYNWERTDYDSSPSQKRDHFMLSYLYKFSPFTTFNITFGIDYLDAKGDLEFDYKIYQLTAGIDKIISPKWQFNIFGGIYYRPSSDLPDILDSSSDNEGFAGGLTINYNHKHWSVTLAAEAGVYLEYGDYNNRGYTPYRTITLSGNYNFTDRLSTTASCSYSYENSPDTGVAIIRGENRRETYDVTIGLSYKISSWLNADAKYSYSEESATNISKKNKLAGYVDHIALIRLTAEYDWFK